jgi:uncharacterized integral membrane protein
MLARWIAVLTTAMLAAAPAAANAAPVVRHSSEGPSATPLIVELIAAAVIGILFLTREPIARAARATRAKLARRRVRHRAARTAPTSGR